MPPNYAYLKLSLEEIYHGCIKWEPITLQRTDRNGKVKIERKTLNVRVSPGSVDGTKIILENQGDQCFGNVAADVVFTVKEKTHPFYERNGVDLKYCKLITQIEVHPGAMIQIPALDGSTISCPIETFENTNCLQMERRGLPLLGKEGKFGDLWITFKIIPGMLSNDSMSFL